MWKFRKEILNNKYWDKTLERVKKSPIYERSHRGSDANQVGFLGEIVIENFLEESGVAFKDDRDATTHDYIINKKYKLDVKTKDRTVLPRIHYENSVPLYNHEHQRPDYYYFVSLLRDREYQNNDIRRFREAFIVGGIDLQTLEKVGKQWNAGETDHSNGTTFWTACINVRMDQLISNEDMLAIFNR
jgi:hypothetical protein